MRSKGNIPELVGIAVLVLLIPTCMYAIHHGVREEAELVAKHCYPVGSLIQHKTGTTAVVERVDYENGCSYRVTTSTEMYRWEWYEVE